MNPVYTWVLAGVLGTFDANAMLIQLTTSLALFAVATTVVDLIMVLVLDRCMESEGSDTPYFDVKYEVAEADFVKLSTDPTLATGWKSPALDKPKSP